MKKAAAILFLLLLLFNFFGYRVLFYYAQAQADAKMIAAIDKRDYSEADLITIKVSLSLPYQNDQKNFERVDGEITLQGKVCRYVKRKVCEGQLVLLCLPDNNKMKLETAKSDFFKSANDIVPDNGSKKSEKSKTALSLTGGEYEQFQAPFLSVISKLTNGYTLFNTCSHLISAPHIFPEQPPELLS